MSGLLADVATALAAHQRAEQQLRVAVQAARRGGCSWAEIARQLGGTRAEAWERFSAAVPTSSRE